MKRTLGAIAVLSLALLFAQSTPTFADVVVNNVLSPFTTIEIVPGYRARRYSIWSPNHHARCYRRWDRYYGEWHMTCARMHYGYGDDYGGYRRGGYYRSGYYRDDYYRDRY